MKPTTILVVDDEPRYIKLLRYNLESVGYRVLVAATGEEALEVAAREKHDLVLLDIMLPGMDGYEVCRRLQEFSTIPIIMLTAKGEERHKVQGLRVGADDYITKPFGAEELLARVEAVLRRSRSSKGAERQPIFLWGDLRIDFAQRKVMVGDREVKLTPTEYRLLRCLASNAGRVVVQEAILDKVWGLEYREHYEGLRVYIRRLRQKIEKHSSEPKYIVTHPGVGYMLGLP